MKTRSALLLTVVILAGCAGSERVVLLPNDGKTGAVAVLNEDGSERGVLNQPYTQASVATASVKPGAVSEQSVTQKYGALIDGLPPAPRVFILYFHEDSTALMPESKPALAELFTEVSTRSGAEVQVTGHTDRVGSVSDNDRLSRLRAEKVRTMLIGRGMQADLIRAVGRGEREPLVDTADEAEEPRNRRVEVTVR